VEDALRDSDWVLAMQEELNSFTRNEVWHLVPRPNQNVVGTKWVFRNKQDEHCWGLVLKCYELRTRQHKILNVNALRPAKHFPLRI
jgi:hypothetical protein